jgi:hypothetical protein
MDAQKEKPELGHDSEERTPEADHRQPRSRWSRMNQAWKQTTISNKLVVLLTFTIALSNLSYVLYARKQWQVMSGQLGEMARQYPELKKSADAAKQSADLTRKQMEGVSAAVIEMPHSFAIDFPVPPQGEARTNFLNNGHVIAHDVSLSFSITLKKANGQTRRDILSKTEPLIPAIPPILSAIPPRPDLIYHFGLTKQEYAQVLNTKAYIIAEGRFGYENGFESRVEQPFCFAYLWGGTTNKGRSVVPCDQAQTEILLIQR